MMQMEEGTSSQIWKETLKFISGIKITCRLQKLHATMLALIIRVHVLQQRAHPIETALAL
jgi:hypothetical protein